MLTWVQRKLLFPPFRLPQLPSTLPRAGGEVLTGTTAEAWFFPAIPSGTAVERKRESRPAPTVVFFHGNAELIDHWPGALEPIRRWGANLVLPEYPGYGRCSGKPSEPSLVAAMSTMMRSLLARDDVDADRIVFFGRSLGGGVACATARHYAARALVLLSTFSSVPDMARRFYLPGFAVRDRFDNREFVTHYKKPIMIVHGAADKLIPISQGRNLKLAAPHAEFHQVDSDHNTFPPQNGETFWPPLQAFLANTVGTDDGS